MNKKHVLIVNKELGVSWWWKDFKGNRSAASPGRELPRDCAESRSPFLAQQLLVSLVANLEERNDCLGLIMWSFLQASGKNLNLNDESQHGLLMQLLKLTHNCLNFDFIGTSTDESSDDLCTVQIPTSWRSGNTATPSHQAAAPHYLESAVWAQDPLAGPLLVLRENFGGWCGSLLS